jgi:hypothetical protein
MSDRQSIEQFFEQIDPDLAKYAHVFRNNGFTSDKTMKYWREQDFENLAVHVPEGHRRLILNMVSKLRTPEIKSSNNRETSKTNKSKQSESASTGSTGNGNFHPRRNISSTFTTLSATRNDTAINDVSGLGRETKADKESNFLSPVERYLRSKEDELECKTEEVIEKKREMEAMMEKINDTAMVNSQAVGSRCSNCHLRNHTVRTCIGDRCASAFLCGDLSKHSDEKLAFQGKKRAITALESSANKIRSELTARQAAYSRVNNSVNKRFENMLVEEFPDEYTNECGVKNWLKIQQDVSAVKKYFPDKSLPSRQAVKTFIKQEKQYRLFPILKRQKSAPTSTAATSTAMEKQLSSYGIEFPNKKCKKLPNEPISEEEVWQAECSKIQYTYNCSI